MVSFPLHFLTDKVSLIDRPDTGTHGVIANDWLAPGEIVSIWGGNILTATQLEEMPSTEQCYAVQVEENLYSVSLSGPQTSDYINHSCEPNLGLSDSITLVAMRLIAPGEEVCFDYAMADGTPIDEFACSCGSERCRGRVTGDDWRLPELWRRYNGFFSPYLRRRIERLKQQQKHGEAIRL